MAVLVAARRVVPIPNYLARSVYVRRLVGHRILREPDPCNGIGELPRPEELGVNDELSGSVDIATACSAHLAEANHGKPGPPVEVPSLIEMRFDQKVPGSIDVAPALIDAGVQPPFPSKYGGVSIHKPTCGCESGTNYHPTRTVNIAPSAFIPFVHKLRKILSRLRC